MENCSTGRHRRWRRQLDETMATGTSIDPTPYYYAELYYSPSLFRLVHISPSASLFKSGKICNISIQCVSFSRFIQTV